MNDNAGCRAEAPMVDPYMAIHLKEMAALIDRFMTANERYANKVNSVLGPVLADPTKDSLSKQPSTLKDILDDVLYRLRGQANQFDENNERMSKFV